MFSQMEPLIPSESALEKSGLLDKALRLERAGAELQGRTAPVVAAVLERHMRAINSYYSNLIEGSATQPWEIRAAAEGELSEDPVKRDLQIEAVAHMRVQDWLSDVRPSREELCSIEFLSRIHYEFYQDLPEHMLWIAHPQTGEKVRIVPGEIRDRGVKVGSHIPPEVSELASCLDRFKTCYGQWVHGGLKWLIAAMASHHRLVWIHPFIDGNGRVARLYTDAYLRTGGSLGGLGGVGLWVVSRGLARRNQDYKSMLAKADMPRQGDYDGRGNLSEKCLLEWCEFMLDIAIDQVEYIGGLLELNGMSQRIKSYVRAREDGLIRGKAALPPESSVILERLFMAGQLDRREIYDLCPGRADRTVRVAVKALKDDGLLTETSHRSPVSWAIPQHAEPYYFPELSP